MEVKLQPPVEPAPLKMLGILDHVQLRKPARVQPRVAAVAVVVEVPRIARGCASGIPPAEQSSDFSTIGGDRSGRHRDVTRRCTLASRRRFDDTEFHHILAGLAYGGLP